MKDQTREDPKILAAAERQMQAWAWLQESAERQILVHCAHRTPPKLGDFITISREAGAGGGELAELVGRKLGWEVLDKNLLDCLAQRFRLSRTMLELVDETTANWAYDVLGTWLDPKIIPHEKYVTCLARLVWAAARRGNVVLVGRGARFMLPRDQGLGVRIVASEKYRIAQIMRREGLGEAKARRWMLQADRGRKEFVERFLHHDVADPHVYDLVVNVEQLGPDAAVELIVRAHRL